MNRAWALGFCLIAVVGLTLRCLRLDNRPMHNDEAVNAIKLATHWTAERYRYDPNEHHGPTLYYGSLAAVWLSGTRRFDELHETTLRLTPALFGVGLILLLGLLRDGLGRGATLAAAWFTCLSPAMVFYSRDYIHEMLLVFFVALAGVGLWRYARERKALWAGMAGLGLGLAYATKETFVFSVAAAAAALALTARMEGGAPVARRWLRACQPGHAALGLLVALGVSQLLFTSFLSNPEGALDSVRTYLPWLERAGGQSPHLHPWYFYLERLAFFQRPRGPVWTEGLILLLAVVGMSAALTGRWLRDTDRRLARLLTFYTLGLTAIYSAIAYKTPWCVLGFLHGFILLAGIGVVVVFEWIRPRWARTGLAVVLTLATAHLAWQSGLASFVRFADWRNPWVYAQTSPDLLRLPAQVAKLAQVHPDDRHMLVRVIAPESDYWPLPYYLRQFDRVGWYDRLPEDPFAPVVIVAAKLGAALDERSDRRWLLAGLFELRPAVFLELYVETELWKKWVETRGPLPE